MTKDTFKESASTWDADQGRLNTAKTVARSIEAVFPFKIANYAMDFGCGTGLISIELLPLIKNLIAVDLSEAMLNIFRKKIIENNLENIELYKIKSELDALPKHPYDIIISSMTIHHVKRHTDLLRNFYDLLNENGLLAIADLVKEQGDFHSDNTGVYHFGFDATNFEKVLKDIGFHNVSYKIIHTIEKETQKKQIKKFPVFLISAIK